MVNIDKRFLMQGERLDIGEIVEGCLYYDGLHAFILGKLPVQYRFGENYVRFDHMKAYQVDPATLEPVAVRVSRINNAVGCPTCETCVEKYYEGYSGPITDYCPWCGQRLDWSVE